MPVVGEYREYMTGQLSSLVGVLSARVGSGWPGTDGEPWLMSQCGYAWPRAMSRRASRTGGTHATMPFQLPARHKMTLQPSTANAELEKVSDAITAAAAKYFFMGNP